MIGGSTPPPPATEHDVNWSIFSYALLSTKVINKTTSADPFPFRTIISRNARMLAKSERARPRKKRGGHDTASYGGPACVRI